MSNENTIYYLAFCVVNIMLLKEVNQHVTEPYMDEPFHVPQVQAYCRGEWDVWDPKITTPPGLYILTLLLKRIFLFKCTLPMLRLTPLLTLLALPFLLTRLVAFHKRVRPPRSVLDPVLDAVVLSCFPIAWFFGFMYYTDVPSLAFVVGTVVLAREGRHWAAALVGLLSCTFRQTNIVWVLYAFAYSQLAEMRFRRPQAVDKQTRKLHDPMALDASPSDIPQIIWSIPGVLTEIIRSALPYILDVALFLAFVVWNGGIVLGDKSNHLPSIHVPQVYYFFGFSAVFGWPALVCGPGGPIKLLKEVHYRMVSSRNRAIISTFLTILIGITIHFFTIHHHPFLLSDNRHYTFYVWRRIFRFHPLVPYIFAPGYLACAWAWFLRTGTDQTLLQSLVLPILTIPTLLLTPLLEPRYFLIPYVLLRVQVTDVPRWAVLIEGAWYSLINWATMYVYLYCEREGVGRFMW